MLKAGEQLWMLAIVDVRVSAHSGRRGGGERESTRVLLVRSVQVFREREICSCFWCALQTGPPR